MKKKILFLVNVDWFFISHRLPIALKAIESGYEVHLACKFSSEISLIQDHGIKCHEIPFTRSSSNPLNALLLLIKVFLILQKLKPNILHAITIKPILLGGIAARMLNIHSVVYAISGLGYIFTAKGCLARIRKKFIGFVYSIALKHQNSCIIFQNTSDQEELLHLSKFKKRQSVIIPGSGVDLQDYYVSPLPTSQPVALMASRLLKDKGVYEFVQASSIVKSKEKNIKFVLVGSPDLANPSSVDLSEINQWVDEGLIEYWGQQTDMPEIFSKSSIVVLPSYREGLPKVLIEAAASGRAVITTDVPGCRDAILHQKTGLLVEIYNPKDLADKILFLAGDIEKCLNMGLAGRKLAEQKFSEDIIIKQHFEVYLELSQAD
jgi:glycosyltransferase involved in cell wall biosynthesis